MPTLFSLLRFILELLFQDVNFFFFFKIIQVEEKNESNVQKFGIVTKKKVKEKRKKRRRIEKE